MPTLLYYWMAQLAHPRSRVQEHPDWQAKMNKQENKRVLMAFQAACDQLWQMVWNWSRSVELRGACRRNHSFISVWRSWERDEVHLHTTFAAILSHPSFLFPRGTVLTILQTKTQSSDENKHKLCSAVDQCLCKPEWICFCLHQIRHIKFVMFRWQHCQAQTVRT